MLSWCRIKTFVIILQLVAVMGGLLCGFWPWQVFAAGAMTFPVALSEAVGVTGTPRLALDIGGVTRYATYASGSGTSTLNFTYTVQAGDVDLDGITLSSPIDLNGGTIKDLAGNDLASLAFTVPNTSGIKVNYPSLSLDFINSDYILSGTHYASLSAFLTASGGTFARSTTATYFDSAGVLRSAAANTPRFDYDYTTHAAKGILIEGNRTNSIRRSEVTGVVAGIPGTPPNGWAYSNSPGITREVVGGGTINGMTYVDVHFYGTATGTSDCVLDPEVSNFITAAAGQTWTFSVYIGLVGGSWPATRNVEISVRERDSGGTLLATTGYDFRAAVPNSTLRRLSVTRTLNDAASAYVSPAIRMTPHVGTSVDYTLRVAAPQMEQGTFATSYIPTAGAGASRGADSLSLPTNVSWYNASVGSFSLFFDTQYDSASSLPIATAMSFDDGTIANRLSYFSNITGLAPSPRLYITESGALSASFTGVSSVTGVDRHIAAAYASNSGAFYDAGINRGSVSSAVIPTVTGLILGARRNAGSISDRLHGHLQSFRYYPARVANAQLAILSQ